MLERQPLDYDHIPRARRLAWWMVVNITIVGVMVMGLVWVAWTIVVHFGFQLGAGIPLLLALAFSMLEWHAIRAPKSFSSALMVLISGCIAIPTIIPAGVVLVELVLSPRPRWPSRQELSGIACLLSAGIAAGFLFVTHARWSDREQARVE